MGSSVITIVGAGPGGLTLARILALHGVACEVFDADRSVDSRHQGGMLNINEDSGLGAIRAAGLYEQFMAHVLEGAEATRILDKFGNVLLDRAGGGGRPEIDRGSLRKILAASLADGVIHWKARVTCLTPVPGGGFRMEFADGRTTVARTIIGGDGAWSKVRPLVSDSKPEYCGITFAELRLTDAPRRHPEATRIVGNGLVFALSDERGFIGHREPNDELCVYAALKVPEDWHGQTTREMLQAKFRDWHPDFLRMIEHCDGEVLMRPLYALPTGHRWNRVPGVTLLGDAAHLMSPFAGEGVNIAMMDAADLVQSIVAEGDIETALAAYESKMFARAEEAAAESAKNLEIIFAPDTPQGIVGGIRWVWRQPSLRGAKIALCGHGTNEFLRRLARTGNQDIHKPPAALLPVSAGRHMGEADQRTEKIGRLNLLTHLATGDCMVHERFHCPDWNDRSPPMRTGLRTRSDSGSIPFQP